MIRPEDDAVASRGGTQPSGPVGGFVATAVALLLLGTVVIPCATLGPVWAETHEDGDNGGGGRGSGGAQDDGHDDAESGHEEGGEAGRGGSGGGGHENGAESGHDSGGHDDGAGEGGEGKGPQAGGDGDGEGRGQGAGAGGAGRPVWAQEGIPEVELGRLNVARSPDQVLDRAYAEALSTFSQEVAAFYRLDLAAMERELATNWDNVRIIDSPLQNLALLRDALDGRSVLRDAGITTDNDTLLAVFLGTASDKSMPVTTDTALAISAILGQPLSQAEAAALAEEAERIRQAILQGHG
jgi:hypothetical protein